MSWNYAEPSRQCHSMKHCSKESEREEITWFSYQLIPLANLARKQLTRVFGVSPLPMKRRKRRNTLGSKWANNYHTSDMSYYPVFSSFHSRREILLSFICSQFRRFKMFIGHLFSFFFLFFLDYLLVLFETSVGKCFWDLLIVSLSPLFIAW